jgi:NAD(P)-dependent dehydrogenase (short-subunit alcohol dehydrogenase family)
MLDLSLFDLRGRVAMVTGGAVGLGRACASALAKAGAIVAIVDLNEIVGIRTADALKARGADAIFLKCNITDEEQVQNTVNSIVNRFGRLDIAVNNAGSVAAGTDFEQPKAEWDRVIDVNLTGLWLCARAQARQMAKKSPPEGKIINIASMWGTLAGANGSYCASKAGVIHLSKTLAVEWGAYNINVNCVSPSWVMTPLLMSSLDMPPERFRCRARELTPLGHVQRPEDIYGVIIFLASSASDYVTGLNLIVDGGHTLNTWYSPAERKTPPRVNPDQEIAHLKEDLAAQGTTYDENGVMQTS